MLRTEYNFELPLGFIDEGGELHRDGVMRLATAADEILPLRDPRVRRNEAYLTVIVLSRVITSLGSVERITPAVIERLFAADLAYLQEFYNRINRPGSGSGSSDADDDAVDALPDERTGGTARTARADISSPEDGKPARDRMRSNAPHGQAARESADEDSEWTTSRLEPVALGES